MKILFKNETKYSKEVYNNFLHFHQSKYGNKYKLYTLLVILLLLFCTVINLKYSNYITSFIFVLVILFFFFYRFLHPIRKINKEIKSEKIEKQTEFIFTFYDNFFIVCDNENTEKIKYWKLYKIFEDESFFYIYANKEYAFVLDKKTFSIGEVSKFIKFIKRKYGIKSKNERNFIYV